MRNPTTAPQGVDMDCRSSNGNMYQGTPAALIAAGIITAAQVPGTPSMPKCGASFVDGVLQPKTARPAHDERWMQVVVYGTKKLRVTKGISAAERDARIAATRAEIDEQLRNRPKADIGPHEMQRQTADASALFKVGDSVFANGERAMVIEPFRLHRVTNNKTGEFLDARDGTRFDWRPGYSCRLRSGEEFFYAACKVTANANAPGHLRLVSTKPAAPALAVTAEFRR